MTPALDQEQAAHHQHRHGERQRHPHVVVAGIHTPCRSAAPVKPDSADDALLTQLLVTGTATLFRRTNGSGPWRVVAPCRRVTDNAVFAVLLQTLVTGVAAVVLLGLTAAVYPVIHTRRLETAEVLRSS